MTWGDVDNDGDDDLYEAVEGRPDHIHYNSLGVLTDRSSAVHVDALKQGAQVYVKAGNVTQYREQNGGYHRWSQNFQRVHVGLAGNTSASVPVRWPNGVTVSYGAIAADRLYRLRQDGAAIVVKN